MVTDKRPALRWQNTPAGAWTAYVEKVSTFKARKQMVVKHTFAYVRPAYNISGLLDSDRGWVVTRNTFDDVQGFDDLTTARVFVESLFALEYN
jgi:hypothetical protein